MSDEYRKIVDGKLGVPKWERKDADMTETQQQVAEYKRAIDSFGLELRWKLDALDVQKREEIALYELRIAKLLGKIDKLEKGEADE